MIEPLIFAVVSALLYHMGTGFVFFLVPLEMALVRRGPRSFALAAGAAFVVIGGVKLVTVARQVAENAPFLAIELFTVLALIGGLALIQLPTLVRVDPRIARFPRVPRLLAATAAVGVLSIPLFLTLSHSETFAAGLQERFQGLATMLKSASTGESSLDLLPGSGAVTAQTLIKIVGELLPRTFLFDYFVLLTFSWWLGRIMGARTMGERAAVTRVVDFRLPDAYVWPLIGSLAAVLLGLVVDTGPLSYVAWNLGLIMAFLYGIAGVGIIRHLFQRYNLSRGLRWLFVMALIVMLFTPGLRTAVLVLVPALGVSETWIRYRKPRSEGEKE